ncbi:MAG: hypothetical protein PHQ27_01035 [Victivallales bacterium]|nr:hypothetical protein [Victivallales bacterium]
MNIERWIICFAAIILAAGLLLGCGRSGSSGDTNTKEKDTRVSRHVQVGPFAAGVNIHKKVVIRQDTVAGDGNGH